MWTGSLRRLSDGAAAMDDLPVDIRDATVVRNGRCVLRRVTLGVRRGEFVGVIGPNGAGKTTLLMAINGMASLSCGAIRTLGVALPSYLPHRLRRRIGYVAQVERIDPRLPMTVRETVGLGAAGRLGFFRRPSRSDRQKIADALEQTGIAHLAECPIGQLSGGEYQRTAIARVLVQTPDLFLFDEPAASIDPRAQQDILCLIQDIHRATNATTLYVTHDLGTLPEECTRLVLMKDGAIWREGVREAMLQPALLDNLYTTSCANNRGCEPEG